MYTHQLQAKGIEVLNLPCSTGSQQGSAAVLPSTPTLPLTTEQTNQNTADDCLQLPTALRFLPLKDKLDKNVHVIRLLH